MVFFRYCWQSLVDYIKCARVKGKEAKACEYFFKSYKSLCHSNMVSIYYKCYYDTLNLFLYIPRILNFLR